MKTSDTYLAASAGCAILSRMLLAAPDMTFLNWLQEENLLENWPLVRDETTQAGLDLLANALVSVEKSGTDALEQDFNALFLLPGSSVPVWESVWTTKEQLLFGEPTFAVRDAYARHGLAAPRLNNEPDDHLGLEFAFLAHLLNTAAQALESGNHQEATSLLQDARTFLRHHPGAWAKTCLEKIDTQAQTEYFKAVAILSYHAVDALSQTLAE